VRQPPLPDAETDGAEVLWWCPPDNIKAIPNAVPLIATTVGR